MFTLEWTEKDCSTMLEAWVLDIGTQAHPCGSVSNRGNCMGSNSRSSKIEKPKFYPGPAMCAFCIFSRWVGLVC